MIQVKKRDGSLESFNRKKILRSIILAGADLDVAEEIVGKVQEKEGMTTDDIRNFVYQELRKADPVIASCYQRTLRFISKGALDLKRGIARISEKTMHRLKIMVGESFHVISGDKSILVVAEKAEMEDNHIELHEEDLKEIDATKGEKIATRKIEC